MTFISGYPLRGITHNSSGNRAGGTGGYGGGQVHLQIQTQIEVKDLLLQQKEYETDP